MTPRPRSAKPDPVAALAVQIEQRHGQLAHCTDTTSQLQVRPARLLEARGDLDAAEQVLRTCADPGDWGAAWRLASLLKERGDLDGL